MKDQITDTILSKINECDHEFFRLNEEAKDILNSNVLNWSRIGKICKEVEIVLGRKILLEELMRSWN